MGYPWITGHVTYPGITRHVTYPWISGIGHISSYPGTQDKYACTDFIPADRFFRWKSEQVVKVGFSQVNPPYPISQKYQRDIPGEVTCRVIPGYLLPNWDMHV